MTPEELASQRWFRSKRRRILDVTEVDRSPLGPGDLAVLEVAFADGGQPERYLMPSVDGREPSDDDGWWSALGRAIGAEERIGHFVTRRAAGYDPVPPGERRLGVEQSNTSVVLGERLILKLYRLLEAGDNPDLEVSAFLTGVGFAEVPTLAGSMSYEADGMHASAAMLQTFIPGAGDAWGAMLRSLAEDPARATGMVREIGALTARLHAALASRPADPDFPARPATVAETAAWRASAESQLAQAVAAVTGDAHDRLTDLAATVRARFADAFGRATGAETVSRIHGDYHLGQLLVRGDGAFSVIDFEGEPARPLEERRRPTSPLRDVAGMLRSLDYAARTAERDASLDADAWLGEARSALLDASGSSGPLVDAFELEKACYEVRYEADNRPDWLWLPLQAIERLADG